jgi:hypothetical protein
MSVGARRVYVAHRSWKNAEGEQTSVRSNAKAANNVDVDTSVGTVAGVAQQGLRCSEGHTLKGRQSL